MPHYVATWQMEIEADTPEDAARQAWGHMRREDSTANVFEIIAEDGERARVDLTELAEWNEEEEG